MSTGAALTLSRCRTEYLSAPWQFFKYLIIIFCVFCMPDEHRPKEGLDPLELELRMAVSHYMGTVNGS